MIILEGTDNVGKTTMARKLCEMVAERTKMTPQQLYGHMSRPPEGFDHVAEYCRGVRAGVQDRYHLGSIVYGRILGGGTYCSSRRMRIVQEYLRWMGCVTVIVTCDRAELARRLALSVDKEEMYRTDQILDAGDAYRALSVSSNMGTPYADIVLDVTMSWPSQEALENIVNTWLRRFVL